MRTLGPSTVRDRTRPIKQLVSSTLCVAAVLAAIGWAQAGADNPTLVGTVGPGFTITLTDASGAAVEHLDAGTYTIQVHDKANVHNFHLIGPGVDQSTEVEFVGDATWTVTLADGIYTFQCDPHASLGMKGRFAVGTAQLPAPKPKPVKLFGSVGPRASIALRTASGGTAAHVKPGRYVVAVSDRSKTDNFHLSGPRVNRKTGVEFRGSATWNVTLVAGVYAYRSDAHPGLRGKLKVS